MNFLDLQQSHLYNFECGSKHYYLAVKKVLLFKRLLLFCIVNY